MPEIKTAIVGSRFRGPEAAVALSTLRRGSGSVVLRAEPDNQYDSNAVACYIGDCHIGYIPRFQNEALSKALLTGDECHCHIEVTLEAIVDKMSVVAPPKLWIVLDEAKDN